MTVAPVTQAQVRGSPGGAAVSLDERSWPAWQRAPRVTLAFTLGLLALLALPRVHSAPGVSWAIGGAAAGMLVWQLALWMRARRLQRALPVVFTPIASHWVQACVQGSIMVWWALYWPLVGANVPLMLAQVAFLYLLEGLISWTRGRPWRLGFGPLPIVLSTNLLLWFRDDWFALQFVMITVGVLGKQFITWRLPERMGHIFNPSAFGQSVIALALIATATTKELTWGPQIAATFEAPYMLVVIFLGGLVVQYLFHVTLMTLAAAATLCLVNLVYTQVTGVYFFVNISIAAPIFLGIHLLITDPSTSPRTNTGRVAFGVLYAAGYCVLFRALDMAGVPLFWDKLLPVPILNLCVPLIDRVCRHGVVGRINAAWEGALSPGRMNLVHMGCWASLFVAMMASGFAYGPHPGDSIEFWKRAVAEGKPYAERSLVIAAASEAMVSGDTSRNGEGFNELGLLSLAGKGVPQNRAAAAQSFAQSCELGDLNGCENVVMQFLFLREFRSEADVQAALQSLEAACSVGASWKACFLVGTAYETGRGRPRDLERAIACYEACGQGNVYGAKALARIALSPDAPAVPLTLAVRVLAASSTAGDAESSWYLGHMLYRGIGVRSDNDKARSFIERACTQGMPEACEALKQPGVPAFKRPPMVVPGWSSQVVVEE